MANESAVIGPLRRVIRFDPAGWRPGGGLRSAIGVAIPLLGGLLAGNLTDGVIAAAGALPAGVASLTGIRGRWTLVVTTTAGMAAATFIGTLTAGHADVRILMVAVFGFFGGLLVTLGRPATMVGTQAIIGLAVFGRFPGGVSPALGHAGLVALGGGLQALLTVIRPAARLATERRAVSHALAQLAAHAHAVPTGGQGGPAGEALAEAKATVDRHLDPTDVETLRAIVDAGSRVRLELSALVTVSDLEGVGDLAQAAAARLRRLAQAVDAAAPPQPDDGLASAAGARLSERAQGATGVSEFRYRYAAARAQALLGQLRALDRLAGSLAGLRRLALPSVVTAPAPVAMQLGNRAAAIARRLRLAATDIGSSTWRHAVRLAATLAVADLVSTVVPWQRGYWVILTAAVVLKPDYATTVQRGAARVIGTAAGAMLAGLLVDGLHLTEAGLVAAISLVAWISYAVFAVSYAAYSLFIGALVVFLLSPTGIGSLGTAADRGLSTVVGGALAVISVVTWPSWEGRALPAALADLLRALGAYAEQVLRGYVDPERLDRPALAAAADRARRARAVAQASLDRAAVEPSRFRPDVSTATGVLAAAFRIVVTLHALRATLEDTDRPLGLPEADRIRIDVTTALENLAARAAGDATAPGAPAELRELQQALLKLAETTPRDGPIDGLRARRLGLLAVHLDPLVDSVDTVDHLLAEGSLAPAGAG